MLHQELGRERMVQIHSEVEHNRLESRLSKSGGLEKGVSRRSLAARSAAVFVSLFRERLSYKPCCLSRLEKGKPPFFRRRRTKRCPSSY
jgi:hypothetical protein